jgi:hypothetical protein
MAKATLPVQALPPDKRPKEPPPPFESMLPSGILARWRFPDVFSIILFSGVVPDPLSAACIDLLRNEKSYTDEKDPARHKNEAANIKGMYGLAAAMLESPKFDPSLEYGDGETLGRREMGYQDIVSLYQLFRFSTRNPALLSTNTNELERTEGAVSSSNDVQHDTSGNSAN